MKKLTIIGLVMASVLFLSACSKQEVEQNPEQTPDSSIQEESLKVEVKTPSIKGIETETDKQEVVVNKKLVAQFKTMEGYVELAINMEPVSAPEGLIPAKFGDSLVDVRLPEASVPMYVYTTQEVWDNSGMNDVVMFYIKSETPAFILEDPSEQKQEFWYGPFYGELKSLIQ